MAKLGRMNNLMVVRESDFGLFLNADDFGEVLLPKNTVPEGAEPGDVLTVFLYKDSEDRLIATSLKPLAQSGEFARLTVKAVERVGAFLDWGLMKDLMLPFAEQKGRPQVGDRVFVRVYQDKQSERIVASMRISRFVDGFEKDYERGQEVDIIVASKGDLGFNVIVNEAHWGLIFESDADRALPQGTRLRAFVKELREDGKLTIELRKSGYDKVTGASAQVLDALEKAGGSLPLGDKSDPALIKAHLEMSKKIFKQAIGALYRAKKIDLEPERISLR